MLFFYILFLMVTSKSYCQERFIDLYSNKLIDIKIKNGKTYEILEPIECLFCGYNIISSGKIIYQDNDTIIFEDDIFNNRYFFKKITNEILEVIDLDGIIKDGEFIYLSDREDSTGHQIFKGQWIKGKKDGDWDYYQKNGEISQTIVYNNGEIIDTIAGGRKLNNLIHSPNQSIED